MPAPLCQKCKTERAICKAELDGKAAFLCKACVMQVADDFKKANDKIKRKNSNSASSSVSATTATNVVASPVKQKPSTPELPASPRPKLNKEGAKIFKSSSNLNDNRQISSGNLIETIPIRRNSSVTGDDFELDVSDDDDSLDEATKLETKKFANVPVEAYLASINKRTNYNKLVQVAKHAAERLKTASQKESYGDIDVIPLPARIGGAALRFKKKGILMLTSDSSLAKLHYIGRPVGALIIVLNAVLEALQFSRWFVAPCEQCVLLIDRRRGTRVSLEMQRDIESNVAVDARRRTVELQPLLIEKQKNENNIVDKTAEFTPPPPSSTPPPMENENVPSPPPSPPSTPPLAELEQIINPSYSIENEHPSPLRKRDSSSSTSRRKSTLTSSSSKRRESTLDENAWNVKSHGFPKLVWYWAKRTLLNLCCKEAAAAHKSQQPSSFEGCESVSDCVRLIKALFVAKIERETTPKNADYELKHLFVQRDERIIFALEKLFGDGGRAANMNVPFKKELSQMEAHWIKIRDIKFSSWKTPSLSDLKHRKSSSSHNSKRETAKKQKKSSAKSKKSKSARKPRSNSTVVPARAASDRVDSLLNTTSTSNRSDDVDDSSSSSESTGWTSLNVHNVDDAVAQFYASSDQNANTSNDNTSLHSTDDSDDDHVHIAMFGDESDSDDDVNRREDDSMRMLFSFESNETELPPDITSPRVLKHPVTGEPLLPENSSEPLPPSDTIELSPAAVKVVTVSQQQSDQDTKSTMEFGPEVVTIVKKN